MKDIIIRDRFISDIRNIITSARNAAIRSVDFSRVQMYWKLGERIIIEEQEGKDRAEYGAQLLKNLGKALETEFGSGFSVRQLERARQFYRTYPIATALRSQFNWFQYKLFMQIDNVEKREYYELEATILASKYQLYLPSEQELADKIKLGFELQK